jgi:hypothetical protein
LSSFAQGGGPAVVVALVVVAVAVALAVVVALAFAVAFAVVITEGKSSVALSSPT